MALMDAVQARRAWFSVVLLTAIVTAPDLKVGPTYVSAQAPAIAPPAARVQAPAVQTPAATAPPAVLPPPLPGVKEEYANIPGARLFYVDSGGRGVPVVFLHAGTGSARVWEHQIPAFTAAGFRVIAYDRRGYGRTTVDKAGPVSTAADDLNALITYLGIDRFHLVATAAGGGVSLDYALSFPQRLRSLTVANSLGNVGGDPAYQAMAGRLMPQQFNALPPDFKELAPSYRAGNPEGTRRWNELERLSRAPGERPAGQPQKNRATLATLEAIGTPTFVITGEADLYSPAPLMKLIADRIKGAQMRSVPDAGHSLFWEKPEIFNTSIIEFIKKY